MQIIRDDIDSCIKKAIIRVHGKCIYCGAIPTTIDHIHPLSLMGTNHLFNLAACCQSCNNSKDSLILCENTMLQAFNFCTNLQSEVKAIVELTRRRQINWCDYIVPDRQKQSIIAWWMSMVKDSDGVLFIPDKQITIDNPAKLL